MSIGCPAGIWQQVNLLKKLPASRMSCDLLNFVFFYGRLQAMSIAGMMTAVMRRPAAGVEAQLL
jgi:hypothetical protein